MFCRKQSWLWMQGDLHRAKTKEVDRKRERHHSVSKLLSGVDDMRIQDALEIENYYRNSEEDEVVSTGIVDSEINVLVLFFTLLPTDLRLVKGWTIGFYIDVLLKYWKVGEYKIGQFSNQICIGQTL